MINEISRVVKDVVVKELAPAQIISVNVDEDVDHDGDPILRVTVVFRSEHDELDPESVLGLVRHLREPLGRLHEARFPIFSFMTPDEVEGAAA